MSQFITPDIQHPEDRNLNKELRQIHQANIRFAPQDYALEAQYGPQYNRLDINNAFQTMMGYTDPQGTYHPGTLGLSRAAAATQRTGDVSDVERLGGRASAAVLAANPYLRGALNNLNARMQGSPILSELNQQAQQGLASGGQLTAQEGRAADQTARSAFAARGMATGNPSAAAEILNRDAAVRQRMAAAQQFATGVQGLNQAQNQFVAQGTQLDASTLSDPFMAILGRPSNIAPSAAVPGGQGFNPPNYMGYAQDLFNTNYNAGVNLGIANANNQAATRAAIASIAGSSIGSDKRIKKNIRATGRKTAAGVPIKRWTYKFDKAQRRVEGVVADDVEKVQPWAVLEDPFTGIKSVDYKAAGATFDILTGAKLRKAA